MAGGSSVCLQLSRRACIVRVHPEEPTAHGKLQPRANTGLKSLFPKASITAPAEREPPLRSVKPVPARLLFLAESTQAGPKHSSQYFQISWKRKLRMAAKKGLSKGDHRQKRPGSSCKSSSARAAAGPRGGRAAPRCSSTHMRQLPVLRQGHQEADNQVNFGDETVLAHLYETDNQAEHRDKDTEVTW